MPWCHDCKPQIRWKQDDESWFLLVCNNPLRTIHFYIMKQSQCKKILSPIKKIKTRGRVVPNIAPGLLGQLAWMALFKHEPWISPTRFPIISSLNSGLFLRSHWRNYNSHIKGAYNPPQITAKQEGLCSLSWCISCWQDECAKPPTPPTSETLLKRGAPVLRSHEFFVGLLFWR